MVKISDVWTFDEWIKSVENQRKEAKKNPCRSCGYCRFYVETGKWHCDESGVEINKIPKNFCFMNEED